MSKTMEAIRMLNDAFESHDGAPVLQAIITQADFRLLFDALMEGPRFKGQGLIPEGSQWQPPADCVAWPVEKQTLVWAECEHNGEKHRTPFWIAPGTLLAGHPNMLRKAGAVQPKPDCSPQAQAPKEGQ